MRLPIAGPAAVLLLLPSAGLLAQAKPAARSSAGDAEFIKDAESGAAPAISEKAAIARLEPHGKVTAVRPGSNGFTCTLFPDESQAPFCGDRIAFNWLVAAMSGKPKPPATGGVAYMAKGGLHYETPEGRIVMEPTSTTRKVREPPHWMLLVPQNPATTVIPSHPNPGGTYIMFAGTPYAHLMVYQDPKMLFKQ
jgi:hypothetical protein